MDQSLDGDRNDSTHESRIKFHKCHSCNVRLNYNKTKAYRNDGFTDAVCFSNRPIAVYEKINVRLIEITNEWDGALRFGFTNQDPAVTDDIICSLPLGHGADICGYVLFDEHAHKNKILHYWFESNGCLIYNVDNEPVRVMNSNIKADVPLWAVIDLYGKTVGIEFVSEGTLGGKTVSSVIKGTLGGKTVSSVIKETLSDNLFEEDSCTSLSLSDDDSSTNLTDEMTDLSQYFTLIVGIIVYIGTSVFRNILKRRLANIANIGETFLLKKSVLEYRLNTIQKSIIFPKDGIYSGDLNDLGMETLYILLQEFGDFKPHSQGWGKFPNDDDHCISANIDRIEFLRKTKVTRYANRDIGKVEIKRTYTILVHAMAGLGVNVQKLFDFLYLPKSKDTERMGSMPKTQFSRDNQSHLKENDYASTLTLEVNNYICIMRLTLDIGTAVLRDLLKKRYPFEISYGDTSEPSKVTREPQQRSYGDIFEHYKSILELKLNSRSRMILFPKKGKYSGDLSECDIPMLYSILRFAGNIAPHKRGWGNRPDDDDRTFAANIERIRIIRNDLMHNSSGKIDKIMYPIILHKLKHTLLELDAREADLNSITFISAVAQSQFDHSRKPCQTSRKEWFFTLSIVCDGHMVDCIIDNRLELQYKTLEKITKKKGLETLSGRPPGFCNQLFETKPADIQQFWRACKFHYDPIGRSPGVCNQLFETEQVDIQRFLYDSFDTTHQEIDCVVFNLLSNIEFEKLFFFHKKTQSSDLNLENELYNSMESNCLNLCRFIFIKSKKSLIISLLRKVLDRAISIHCRDILEVVTFRIIKEFFQKHKKVLDKETRMWIGTECACETTKLKGYEDCLCFSSKPMIIIERNQSKFQDSTIQKLFSGFSTKIIDFIEPNSTEASVVANQILETSNARLIEGNIPGKIAKTLFKEHSNLSIIYPSSMKSKGFKNPGSHITEELKCINLVCKVKGIVPVGETHFPLKIEGVPTDVLQGATRFLTINPQCRVGDKVISTNKQSAGTLGGFVKYYGLNTFLTCAHVVFGIDRVHSVTKEEIHHANCHLVSSINSSGPTECILIRHVFKHDNTNPSETSIDAALAVIKNGDISMFNIAEDGHGCISCTELGLKTPYLNHNAIDPIQLRDARAFCGVSGNQKGVATAVRKPNVLIRTPAHIQSGKITMFNQLCLYGMQFQPGDSGTCVYVHTQGYFNRQTGCIGMLLGKSTCGHFVLTPMKEILKIFDL